MAKSPLRILAWSLAAIVVIAAGLFLYLRNADLSVYEEQVESYVSKRTGYTLDIAGRFELHVGDVTRLIAEDVTLREPDSDKSVLEVGHLTFAFETWSIFRDTFVVDELLVRDINADVALSGEKTASPTRDVNTERVAFRSVEIEGFKLHLVDPRRSRPLDAVVEQLRILPDAGDVLDLHLLGSVNELPLEASGTLGPWPNLISGRDIMANLDLSLGHAQLSIEGSVRDIARLQGVEMLVNMAGPDVARPIRRLGLPPFAEGPFALEARIEEANDGQEVRLAGNIGAIEVLSSGNVDRLLKPDSAVLEFRTSGPDSRFLGEVLGVTGMPADSFRITGGLTKDGASWEALGVHASIGENVVTADGAMTVGKYDDSAISFHAVGPDVSLLAAIAGLPGLQPRSYDITANLHSDARGVALRDVVALFDDVRLEVDGVVTDEQGADGTFLNARMQGPDLHELAVLSKVPYLPVGAFDVSARVDIDIGLVRVKDVIANVDELAATADGTIGLDERAGEFDIQFDLRGPDVAQFIAVSWLSPFAGSEFTIQGGVSRGSGDLQLHDVQIDIGDFFMVADGAMSLRPMSNSSDLEFHASGSSLKRVGQMFGSDFLVDKPFSVGGQVSGTPSGFAVHDLIANLGTEDINGEITVNLEDKPRVTGQLNSAYLDLRQRLQEPEEETSVEEQGVEEDESQFVFSDKPLNSSAFQAADLDIGLRVERLRSDSLDVTDFAIDVVLQDGELHIDPIRMTDGSGSVSGRVGLVPTESGYAVDALLEVDDLHLGVMSAANQAPASLPPLSGKATLAGAGNSLHEIMASSNGMISARQGAGRVKEFVTAAIFRDVFLEALRTINPLREDEDSRNLDCSIIEISIVDGVLTLDEVAMQTDQLLMVAMGEVDFETEKLQINFRATPREGIGVTLGTVANSFLGVRNTLKSPRVTLDPAGTVATTGAAIATGGISILARGLFERLSAEKSICEGTPDE